MMFIRRSQTTFVGSMSTSMPRGQKRNLAEALAEDALLVHGGDRVMRSVASSVRGKTGRRR